MKTYKATVTREGKWWMVAIPELSGLTQARRLSEAGTMAREYIGVTLDIPDDTFDVDVEVQAVGDLTDVQKRLASIREARNEATRLEREVAASTAALARELVDHHVALRDVGTILNVSHQRAHQLVNTK